MHSSLLPWSVLLSSADPADSILNPEAPLALRLSGQLLLGVVKIYNKKVLYLFQDCNDALSKMQQVRNTLLTLACPVANACIPYVDSVPQTVPLCRLSSLGRLSCQEMARQPLCRSSQCLKIMETSMSLNRTE